MKSPSGIAQLADELLGSCDPLLNGLNTWYLFRSVLSDRVEISIMKLSQQHWNDTKSSQICQTAVSCLPHEGCDFSHVLGIHGRFALEKPFTNNLTGGYAGPRIVSSRPQDHQSRVVALARRIAHLWLMLTQILNTQAAS